MVRSALGIIIGFILVCVESFIVADLKNVQSIDFGGIGPFISVWAMNFFLVFSILTDFKIWYENRELNEESELIQQQKDLNKKKMKK